MSLGTSRHCTAMGITRYEGSRSHSLPQIDKDPLRTFSKMVLEMKSSNLLHVLLL